MKKLFALSLALVLALSLAACDSGNGGNNSGNNNNSGSVTIDSMKKAALDAGYEVDNSYSTAWGDGIIGGFSVTFSGKHGDTTTPVLEFKDKASADAVAKQEMDAGYNYPIQNGNFLTFASASGGVIEDQDEKTFLENLINGRAVQKTTEEDPGGDDFAYGSGADYISAHLTGDYSVTYRFTEKGEESYEWTLTKTSEGVYIKASGSEMLLVKIDDNTYECYTGSLEDGFTKVGMQVTQIGVDGYVSAFTGYMTWYGAYSLSGMKKDGTETVAGRTCDKFSFDYTGYGAAVKYEYWIDQASGVCMKFSYEGSSGGQGGAVTFECVEFKIGGVSLPSYEGTGDQGLTLADFRQAVRDMGYEVREDNMASSFAPVKPVDGFIAVFATESGEFDLEFFEFDSEADAQTYKASEDEPDAMFPTEYIIRGRFLGETIRGFSDNNDAAIRTFVEDVFAAAEENA